MRIPIDWSDRSSLHAIVRGIVGTKCVSGLTNPVMQATILPMIIEAFLAMYKYTAQYPSESIPIRFLFHPGQKSLAKSEFWRDTVFLDLPWPRGCPRKPIVNAKLALFNITIDPLREDVSGDTTREHSSSKEPFSLEALRAIGDTMQRLGVHAVMSQKIIPKYLQMWLSANDIFVLDRLSINHIRKGEDARISSCLPAGAFVNDLICLCVCDCFPCEGAVQQLSGAVVLGDWRIATLDEAAFGFLTLITTQDIRGKKYIRLHRSASSAQDSADMTTASVDRSSPVSTMVLTAPDKFAYEELSYSIETALKRLCVLAENPEAVAGGGCMEIHLASYLRQKAELLRAPSRTAVGHSQRSVQDGRGLRQLRLVLETFASCITRVVTSLSHSKGDDHEAIVEQLQEANLQQSASKSQDLPSKSEGTCELYGWDPCHDSPVPVASYVRVEDNNVCREKQVLGAHILDSFPSKRDALVLAMECTCSIVRIASAVRIS